MFNNICLKMKRKKLVLSDAFKKLSEARSNHGLSPATLWRSRTYRF